MISQRGIPGKAADRWVSGNTLRGANAASCAPLAEHGPSSTGNTP
jgi:hypothetical protein